MKKGVKEFYDQINGAKEGGITRQTTIGEPDNGCMLWRIQ